MPRVEPILARILSLKEVIQPHVHVTGPLKSFLDGHNQLTSDSSITAQTNEFVMQCQSQAILSYYSLLGNLLWSYGYLVAT